ncbi:hypothetical protein O9K63_10960 [Janibacter cremeus]|uniref:hypothetical protein n=1 Tax=Janibacter cremeus TaxID=1285192 RepID=UPI0023FA11A6|nr:hypothetical protein [Janibacter cremeus]WEV77111.1 hypothetical protein O9K63_10960 [Janibacter cremeus]
MDPANWDPVAGTRLVLVCTALVLVHGLWIVTWCAWRGLGWARFVAAALLLPVTGLLTWLIGWSVWEASTRANGWSWGSQLLTQLSTGRPSLVPMVLVPAVVVAVSVLLTVRVPARDPSESMFVRPAWRPRTLLRGTAVLGAVLGTVVLTAIPGLPASRHDRPGLTRPSTKGAAHRTVRSPLRHVARGANSPVPRDSAGLSPGSPE